MRSIAVYLERATCTRILLQTKLLPGLSKRGTQLPPIMPERVAPQVPREPEACIEEAQFTRPRPRGEVILTRVSSIAPPSRRRLRHARLAYQLNEISQRQTHRPRLP